MSAHMYLYLGISVYIQKLNAYLLVYDYIWLYLKISVYIKWISSNICVYQTNICTYILISGHICLYQKT